MTNFGYNNRWIRLIKDVVFAAVCCWLFTRKGLLTVLVGAAGLYWYGRDAYYQAKALWQEKTYKAPPRQEQEGPTTQTQPQDGKITLSNDAKEAEYTKE
ncbi:MAG: hypothetical protein IJ753_02375 [Bacteroidales bacterium]|nr:hypothetical protein [Bacteroidales bacterium]MBQ9702280.1 hypothetical protein [Bacteroidales bacterium]MBR1782349.1 hypothetical protein [Bacteroidales bacterium]